MAAVIDSQLDFSIGSSATVHNITFDNVAGTFLIVGFTCLYSTGVIDNVASATFNGVPLTKINHQNGSANNRTTNQWSLLNPATGSNTLTITLTNSERIYGTVLSYTGHDDINPVGVSAKGTTSGTTVTFPITTGTDDSVLFCSAQTNRAVSSYDTNTTSVHSISGNTEILRSTSAIAVAGATTLGLTFSVSDPGLPYIITEIKPAAVATNTSNFFAFF